MSAHVLMCCWPFPGHVNPNVAVGRALLARGNRVTIYSGEPARATVEAEGIEFEPFTRVAAAWEPVLELERRAKARRRGQLRAQAAALRGWLVGTVPAQVADLEDVIERRRPDVIVSEPAMLGPVAVLWEKHGVPVAALATFMGPLIPGPDAPIAFNLGLPPAHTPAARAAKALAGRVVDAAAGGLRRQVDAIREEHGLGPLGCSLNAHTARLPLYLVGNLPELDYGRRDLPPSVRYVGPFGWQPQDDPETEAWLAEIPGDRPWVHVTEGTSNSARPFLLQAALDGLGGGSFEVILTTGNRDLAKLGLSARPAENVHVAPFLNHGELLPRCAAIVTTGGAGTVLAAARAGIPQLVVPCTWDQPDNGRRVVEAGIGLSLSRRRCDPRRLREAVVELLADEERRQRAKRLSRRLRRTCGAHRAAELLEELAPVRGAADAAAGRGLIRTGGKEHP